MRKNQQQVCQMMAHERMPYVAPQSTVITLNNEVLFITRSDGGGGHETGHQDNCISDDPADCDEQAKDYVFDDDNAFVGPKWENEFED